MTGPVIQVMEEGTLAFVHRHPPEDVRRAWCRWLLRHSVGPCDVISHGGVIQRQVEARRIRYLAYLLDEAGAVQTDKDGDAQRIYRDVQLEAAPAPFPEEG